MATEIRLPIPATKPRTRIETHPKAQKIDVAKALKLRLMGNTLEEIGKVFDCSRAAVHEALQKFEAFTSKAESGTLTAFSENRAELFNVVEHHLTASLLDPDAMQKASLNNRAYALKVIHEARRLETGQSTGNISVLASLITKAEERLCKPAQVTPQPVVVEQVLPSELPITGGMADE